MNNAKRIPTIISISNGFADTAIGCCAIPLKGRAGGRSGQPFDTDAEGSAKRKRNQSPALTFWWLK
jgi:hypothetical protein